jgi:hypothetical protein
MCKQIYLPVDEKRGKAKTAALNELSNRFAAASATSFYCVETGLVRIPKTVRCTKTELQQLERRIFDGAVTPAKLVALRGSRQESSNSTGHQADFDPDGRIIMSSDSSNTDDVTASVDLNTSFDSGDSLAGDIAVGEAAKAASYYDDLELGSAEQEDSDVAALGPLYYQELVPAADYLLQNRSDIPDNRCCIKQDDDSGDVEVQETTSQRPVEEEDV